jgi:hypothetical protein
MPDLTLDAIIAHIASHYEAEFVHYNHDEKISEYGQGIVAITAYLYNKGNRDIKKKILQKIRREKK